MECKSCLKAIDPLAKFCPECGTAVVAFDEGVSRDAVNLEWLANSLEILGYTCKITDAEVPHVSAQHETRPGMLIGVNANKTLITVQAFWTLKGPSWGHKGDFFSVLNSANQKSWIVTFHAVEPMNSIVASSAMWICERTSKRDVAGYVDGFLAGALDAIQSSGILKFA